VLWLDLTMHHQSMNITFEAQGGRTYVLWNATDITDGEWVKVQEFPSQDSKRTIIHDLPVKHRSSPNGYYRITIPAVEN
jgi:hypothetical protein